MHVLRHLIACALAAGLMGCAAPGPSTATGPICTADVVDRPFVGGLLGLSLDPQIAAENTRRRQEARANQPAWCPPEPARVAQATPPQQMLCIYGNGVMSCFETNEQGGRR